MAEELPIPIEIPWQLASTTQAVVAGQPSDTAITLFTFEPDDEEIAKDFPDQRVIFLKVTTTISPAPFPPNAGPLVATMLGEGVPCYHAQLDLIVRKKSGELGTIRPYFHTAAPLHREMLQTGVIGGESYEGAADHQSIGRSASQVHETSASIASTASFSAGGSFLGIGASASLSTTNVSGRRTVDQVSDTTTRDASTERRELVSHMTRVENVLTLLNTKYVGTPYLRFSLSPRPLEQLSVDPSDPSLWFGQLLQRRSSGIEGVQDYTIVVIVPKGEDFCVEARLKRVCVLDDPPVEPDFSVRFSLLHHLGRLLNYVERAYPIGTLVDDLDVDIRHGTTGALAPKTRPVIENWVVAPDGRLIADVITTNGNPVQITGVLRGSANFKTFVELWLETLIDEYERDCARSPLETGVLLGETRILGACFTFTPVGGLAVTSSTVSVSPLRPRRIGPRDLGLAGLPSSSFAQARSVRAKSLEAVVRWNALAARLGRMLDNPSEPEKGTGKFDDRRVVNVLIDRWAKLWRDDPRNLHLAELGKHLGFDRERMALLKEAGINDLADLAQALKAVPVIERHNRDLAAADMKGAAKTGRAPIHAPITRQEAAAIIADIGRTQLAMLDDEKGD